MKIVDAAILLSKENFVARANPGAVMRAEAKTVPPALARIMSANVRTAPPQSLAKLPNRAENLTIPDPVHPLKSSTYFPPISRELPRTGENGDAGTPRGYYGFLSGVKAVART